MPPLHGVYRNPCATSDQGLPGIRKSLEAQNRRACTVVRPKWGERLERDLGRVLIRSEKGQELTLLDGGSSTSCPSDDKFDLETGRSEP